MGKKFFNFEKALGFTGGEKKYDYWMYIYWNIVHNTILSFFYKIHQHWCCQFCKSGVNYAINICKILPSEPQEPLNLWMVSYFNLKWHMIKCCGSITFIDVKAWKACENKATTNTNYATKRPPYTKEFWPLVHLLSLQHPLWQLEPHSPWQNHGPVHWPRPITKKLLTSANHNIISMVVFSEGYLALILFTSIVLCDMCDQVINV